ncbi:MAG: STAS domain-containing protein, partial [Verrucomicrobia bacterium]|nr:STAS domain-containing protein [Verrucomicrobiota bacterium]
MAVNQATFSLGHSYDDDCVVIKIAGRANCNSTENFSNLIDTEIKKGVMKFIFDLSECQIMDSSFLGTIVAKMEAAKKEKNCLWVELF